MQREHSTILFLMSHYSTRRKFVFSYTILIRMKREKLSFFGRSKKGLAFHHNIIQLVNLKKLLIK